MSTYADNRRRQQRLRGTNQKSPVQDRIGAFLNFLAGPVTYNQGVVDARVKAMERGSKIPFLPEFGLSEGFQSYADQAGRDLQAAFNPAVQTPEPEPVAPVAPEAPVISEQMSPESLARQAETDRMVDVIMNVPLKKEPELSAEDAAKKAFLDPSRNNPALEAGLDPDFLFARHKANLVSKLAKQDVKPADLEGTEQAFLAKQLEKYIGNKRQFNSGRDRGF